MKNIILLLAMLAGIAQAQLFDPPGYVPKAGYATVCGSITVYDTTLTQSGIDLVNGLISDSLSAFTGGITTDSVAKMIHDSLANVSADSALFAEFADSAGVAKKLTNQTRVYADTIGTDKDTTYIISGKATKIVNPLVSVNDTTYKNTIRVEGKVIASDSVKAPVLSGSISSPDSIKTKKVAQIGGQNLIIGAPCSVLAIQPKYIIPTRGDSVSNLGSAASSFRDIYTWRVFLGDSLNFRQKNDSTYYIYRGNLKKDSSNTW